METALRRLLIFGLLLAGLAVARFGAVHGRLPQCNGISITPSSTGSTLVGCGSAPTFVAPSALLIVALITAAACRLFVHDPEWGNARRAVLVFVGMAAATVGLFAALRPGLATVLNNQGANEVLCGRPIQDLRFSADGDLYTAACRDLAQGRLVVVAIAATVLVASVAAMGWTRRPQRSGSAHEHDSGPAEQRHDGEGCEAGGERSDRSE